MSSLRQSADFLAEAFTAFDGTRLVAHGSLVGVARAAHAEIDRPVLVIDDTTGRQVELDLRGSIEDVLGRLNRREPEAKPTRGRPKLGVTAREVTLLPSQWDWLAAQPGGASATLRRLVDSARRDPGEAGRKARDAAYRVMTVLGGDLPGYEEATRAFFAGDLARFHRLIDPWPTDVRDYVRRLMAGPAASVD